MDIVYLLEQLQAIARTGLAYTDNPHDKERYEKLLELSVSTYSGISNVSDRKISEALLADLGYITPLLWAGVALFDEQENVLLLRRSDNSRWCLPCGFVDVGESPEDCALREAREEANLDVKILEVVGIFTTIASISTTSRTNVGIIFLGEIIKGIINISHEHTEVRFMKIENVQEWHSNQRECCIASRSAYRTLASDKVQ